MSRNSTHINCNQIAGTVNQGIWKNDCDPCVESAYQIPNITQWLRHKFEITNGGGTFGGPVAQGDITTGADISGWNDLIGTNNATQTTAGQKPHWNDTNLSILFDNIDDSYTLSSVTYAAADDFVVTISMTPTTGSFANNMLWHGDGGNTNVLVQDDTTIKVTLNSTLHTITGPSLEPQAGCDVYNIVLRRSNGICQLFVAGVPWGPSFVHVGAIEVREIGSDGTNHLNGSVYNFMQFDRALTDKEIWCLDCYLCGDDDSGEPTSCRIDHDKLDCNGDTDGSITATFLGAVSGSTITYLWSTGATTQTISSLGVGTYTCTLTSNNATGGTTADDVVTTCTGYVTEPAAALVCTTTTVQPVYVNGVLSPATISVGVTGGWGAPMSNSNITWEKDGSAYTPSGADHFNISTSVAGTYAYTVSDVNGCECTGSVAITIPGDPTLEISCGHTPVECHDETAAWGVMFDASTTFSSTASITMVDSSGTAHAQSPISVSSLPASSTNFGQTGHWWLNTVANQRLGAGTIGETWTITVTDTGSPVRTATCTIVLSNPEEIVINETISQPTACEGLNWSNGSLSFIATGGTGAFTYEIEKTTATTSTVATNNWPNPGAGNYTLKATDANGCVVTKNVTITCPMDPMITISHVATAVSCTDEKGNSPCDGQVVFTPSATTSSGYTFTLEVMNSGGTVINTVGPLATFPAYTMTAMCAGPYTYNYTATLTSSGATTILANNVSFNILQPSPLSLTAVVTDDGCNGAPGTGAIDTTVSGGTSPYTYAWTASNGGVIISGQADDPDLTTLVAGSYTVTVTDARGCIAREKYFVNEPCELNTILRADEIECGDDGNGVEFVCNWTLDGHNGMLNQSWVWSHDKATMLDGTLYSPNGPAHYSEACWFPYHNGATNGTPLHDEYSSTCRMQFEPGQGMVQQLSGLTIGETYNFSIDVGTGSTASGVWKMGVYTYGLPLNLVGSETSVTATGVTTVTFVATATDHIINVHYDGVAGAGSTSTWNRVLPHYETTALYNSLIGIRDGGQLGGGVSMSEDGKTLVTGNLHGEFVTYKLCCYGTSGVTYPYAGCNWIEANREYLKNGNAFPYRRENIEISHDGTRIITSDQFWDGDRGRVVVYDWVVSDATNCTGYWTQVGENFQGLAGENIGTVAISADKTVIAIGSTEHDSQKGEVRTYTYDGSAWNQRGSVIDGQVAGDKFGWALALSDDGAEVAIGAPEHDGLKGTVQVWAWNGSAWAKKGADIDGAAGDRLGYSVSLNGAGDVVAAGSVNHDQAKGTARVYTYASSAWGQTGADIDGLYIGDVTSSQIQLNTAGDSLVIGGIGHAEDGWTNTGHIMVWENISGTWTLSADLADTVDSSSIDRMMGTDVAMNGSGSMVVSGAPNATMGYINGVMEGELIVYEKSTESNGATGTGCLMFVSVTGQNVTSNTTDITVLTDCGTPKYTYAWTLPTTTPANTGSLGTNSATSAGPLTGVPAGTYQVVTTDANGCTDTASIVIAPAGNITNSITVTAQAGCDRELCAGAAESDNTWSGATYLWTTDATYITPVTGGVGSSSYNITQQCAGTYYLRVTLDNGCVWEGSCTITESSSNMTLSAVITDADMCDDCCGAIDLSVAQTPSGAPYTYAWSNGQTTQDLTCVPPGTYTVIVTDDNGCTETATYTVGTSNYQLTFGLSITTQSTPDCKGCSVQVSPISGGQPPYAWQWTFNGANYSAGTTGTNAVPDLCPNQNGTWCLTVHDDKGCTHTECIGIKCVPRQHDERSFDCTPLEESCDTRKYKEDILGKCDDERHGKVHALSGDGTTVIAGSRRWSSEDDCDVDRNHFRNFPKKSKDGRVKVYTLSANGSQTQKGSTLHATGTQDSEYFGSSVAINTDGTVIAVGVDLYTSAGINNVGYVLVYDWNTTVNDWAARPVLQGDPGVSAFSSGEQFGEGISLSGDGTRLAVLASADMESGQNQVWAVGSVRVYDWASNAWTQKGTDIYGDGASSSSVPPYHIAPEAVKISRDGTTLFVGSHEVALNGPTYYGGKVSAYRFSSGAWNQIGSDMTLPQINSVTSNYFANSIACSTDGNIVAVGGHLHGDSSDGVTTDATGAVQVYKYASSAWSTKGALIQGTGLLERLGWTVDMSGDGLTMIVGSPFADGNKGHIILYKFKDTNYEPICPNQAGAPFAVSGNTGGWGTGMGWGIGNGDGLGYEVSMNTAGTVYTYWYNGGSKQGVVVANSLTYVAAGSSNICVERFLPAVGTYSSMALCQAACTPSESYDCIKGQCFDPGDGSGEFASLALCREDGCETLKVRYDCKKTGCVGAYGVGTYATYAACVSACGESGQNADEYYCEILCASANDAEKYKEDTEENREKYNDKGEEKERRKKEDVTTGGGRCRIRKNVSPETGSTTYYSTLKACQSACPWCKDKDKYDDIS